MRWALAHRARDTIQLLQQETPDFIGPDLWPPNSPDSRVDGAIECWTFDPAVGVPVPLAAGGRVAIVGQLLFAPWAWAYSALHP